MDDASPELLSLQAALAGRFHVEREVGRGGMGVVYLARDLVLDRHVAIKVLRGDRVRDSDHRARFQREARTAAGLAHPNIVPIHGVEVRDDLICFVMGFVAGETLGDRVRREGPLAPTEVVRIVREVAWALAYAHGRGVIHRDVKPDNILLEQGTGRALVTDFGIARVLDQRTATGAGEMMGSLHYMAPEQADPSAQIDGRADLYALGATAFFALAGRLPFEATSAPALLAMHLAEPAPPVTTLRPAVPSRLGEAVGRCLAKDPTARFGSAEELAEALGRMTPARALPPAILGLMSDASQAGALVLFPGMLYSLGVMYDPAWALPLGVMWAGLGAFGILAFLLGIRTAVRSGHTPEDVGAAAGEIAAARWDDAEAALSREEGRRLVRWLTSGLGRVGAGLLGSLMLLVPLVGVYEAARTRDLPDPLAIGGFLVFASVGLGSWLAALRPETVRACVMGGPVRGEGGTWLPRLWKRLWDNPATRGIFWLAAVGARGTPAAPRVEERATELILGRAADDLFGDLPRDQRDRIGDVPQVIRRLEEAAGRLRARRDELERAIAGAGATGGAAATRRDRVVAELDAARGRVEARLHGVLVALEDLRLDLLRLKAGVVDAGDITDAIAEARRVGADIAAEMEGRAQAERELGGV